MNISDNARSKFFAKSLSFQAETNTISCEMNAFCE